MLLSVFLYAWVCYCLCFVCLGGGGSFFSSELVCYKHVFSCMYNAVSKAFNREGKTGKTSRLILNTFIGSLMSIRRG